MRWIVITYVSHAGLHRLDYSVYSHASKIYFPNLALSKRLRGIYPSATEYSHQNLKFSCVKIDFSFSSLSPFKCASFFSCLVYTLITYFFYYSGSHLNYPLDSQGISHKPGSLDLYWKHRILSPERVKSPLPTKMHICSCCVVLLVAQLHLIFATLWTIIPPGSSVRGINFPGENTGVGYHFLLQGIFSQNLQPST